MVYSDNQVNMEASVSSPQMLTIQMSKWLKLELPLNNTTSITASMFIIYYYYYVQWITIFIVLLAFYHVYLVFSQV